MALVPANFQEVLVECAISGDTNEAIRDPAGVNITINDLARMTDEDVDDLAEAIRKPGGTKLNPRRAVLRAETDRWDTEFEGAINDVARAHLGPRPPGELTVPERVPNLGCRISVKGLKLLKGAVYLAKHRHNCGHGVAAANFTAAMIRRWLTYKNDYAGKDEPEEQPKLTKADPTMIIEFIEEFEQTLFSYEGKAGALSYIVRTTAIPDPVEDPMFGEPNSIYTSPRHEMAARVSVDSTVNMHFNTDNGRVFDLLNDAVKDHQRVQTWIKSFLAKRDGRGACIAFKVHYLGSLQMDTIASTAEDKLLMSQYHGKRPRYNFECYVSVHQKAHIDIEKATGMPLSGRDKVR